MPLTQWGSHLANMPPQRPLPGLRLIQLMYQVAEVSADIHTIVTARATDIDLSKDTMARLINQLEALDTTLLAWEGQLPETWQYCTNSILVQNAATSGTLLSIMTWHGAPINVYDYADSQFVFPHCIYFATRVILSQNLVSAHTWMIQNCSLSNEKDDLLLIQAAQRKQAREIVIAALVEIICGSVPAILGHSKGAPPSELPTPLSMPTSPSVSPSPRSPDPSDWSAGPRGLFCLWLLRTAFDAVQNDEVKQIVGPELGEWIAHVASFVNRLSGIPQAPAEYSSTVR